MVRFIGGNAPRLLGIEPLIFPISAKRNILRPSFMPHSAEPDGRGRPWKESPAVLNGILSILQACHRRFEFSAREAF